MEDGEEVSAPVNSDDAGVYTYLVGRDGSLMTMRANSNTEPRSGAGENDDEEPNEDIDGGANADVDANQSDDDDCEDNGVVEYDDDGGGSGGGGGGDGNQYGDDEGGGGSAGGDNDEVNYVEYDEEDVDTENTSLLEACFRRHYNDALMFLDTGADPNETNEDGLCALYIAVQRNCLEIVKTLISHGADVNLQEEGIGATPLYVAAHLGHATIAEELLRRPDILPNIVTRTDGATPLIVAAAHGHGKVVVELLLHGVDRSCKLTTDGTTAEDCADAAGYTGIVKLLRVDNRLARLQLDRAVSGFVQNGYE